MENEIKVNEYVKTKAGYIDKVDALYGMIENTIHLEKLKWFDIRNIVKHSQNIIDLIEVGDYVNGCKIKDISFDNFGVKTLFCYKDAYNEWLNDLEIKSIVTKEQFESISYKVERK